MFDKLQQEQQILPRNLLKSPIFTEPDKSMTSEVSKKLTTIETLYTEQEYTIATLNEIVTRQDNEITNIRNDLQWLKQQLQSLKEQIPDGASSESHEPPPHY